MSKSSEISKIDMTNGMNKIIMTNGINMISKASEVTTDK